MILNNQRGQSMLETAVMAFMMVVAVACLIGVIYMMYSSYWAEHILYESLICTQERGIKAPCVAEAREKFNRILFLRDNFKFFISARGSISRGTFEMIVDFPFLDPMQFKFHKELRI